MSGNDQPDFAAIRNGEELGLVFSEDKKTLLACVNEEIRELVIPGHVTAVGSHAFFDKCKKLTRITLHSGITDIGCGAFAYCENLKEIIIPDGVERSCLLENELECVVTEAVRKNSAGETEIHLMNYGEETSLELPSGEILLLPARSFVVKTVSM